MNNQYTGITNYYDLLMNSGYYDYTSLAEEAYSVLGRGCQILELGVGTGLLAEEYIALDETCQFTGIDITTSMLKLAQNRLGDRVDLREANALTMELNRTFDAMLSNGGVWVFLDWGDRLELASHLSDYEQNLQGLHNIVHHLREGGLILLNRQKPGVNFAKKLPGGITYSQVIEPIEDNPEYRLHKKCYSFEKDGQLLAQEELTMLFFKQTLYPSLFQEVGLEIDQSKCCRNFITYQKQSSDR
ncbi:class I SAM-dependent methyltransferase [Roseofilum sp. Guam]|uniref:class I SAM-dependent methyltransferase n=1 Tax=Roseofilum sp. Guam TaxID=2821502 RepID=UPI001B1A90AD|nr:class I SAM-dependent methyltransferase [Roseofilum sp. Guam]MBP0028017.1 class I SAM-dependent methyltransferase [Roseofilum sp. Guam]